MKLQYLCECCDAVVDEVEFPAILSGDRLAGLTGVDPGHIIKIGNGSNGITITTLCDDCRETLYGGPGSSFFGGPALH